MLNSKITNRYAKALLDLAISENSLDKISQDIGFVQKSVSSIRELSLLLKSPIVKRDKKKQIFHEIFVNKISDTSLKFCELVINRQRSELLPDIIRRFFELRNEFLNIKNIEVVSAVELDENQINLLKSILEQNLNKKVWLSLEVDRTLIGGFKVKIDDTVVDASLQYQLAKLKKKFLSGTEKLN